MKKYYYIITTLLIFFLTALIILLIVYIHNKNKVKPDDVMITTPGENLSFELNNKIFPQDYLAFEQKTKEKKLDYNVLYESIYRFVKYGEKLTSTTLKYNNVELKKYYREYDKTLHLRGIRSEDDFVNIVGLLREVYKGNDVFYRNVKLITKDNSYEIDIEYNNNKVIKLNLIIVNAEKSIYKLVPIQ